MCFGIRILILFQLNTLNIPIQNIRCPKTPKTHARTSFSPQPLFVKLELCCLCARMPNPICVTGNVIHESHCSVQCFVLGYVIKDESHYRVLLFLLQRMKWGSMCFTHRLSFISELKAHMTALLCPRMRFWCFRHLIF